MSTTMTRPMRFHPSVAVTAVLGLWKLQHTHIAHIIASTHLEGPCALPRRKRGSVVSTMQTSFQQLQQWTDLNNMQINFSKTKEMILGPLAKLSPQPQSCNSGSPPSTVERVQYFKLLGITVSSDLNWQKHIDTIISKASSRFGVAVTRWS